MKNFIHITKADREFIAKALGVTERTVYYATRFDKVRGVSKMADKIRALAIKRGGVEMTASTEMETLHDADGYIRQYLPNGAEVEISKKADAGCNVIFDGKVVRRFERVMVSDIPHIQQYAASL